MERSTPKSPCISVCALNDADVCIGCFRTANEIASWIELSPEQRMEVLRLASGRRKADQPFLLK